MKTSRIYKEGLCRGIQCDRDLEVYELLKTAYSSHIAPSHNILFFHFFFKINQPHLYLCIISKH